MHTQYIYPIISILSPVYISQKKKKHRTQSRADCPNWKSADRSKVGCERNCGDSGHPKALYRERNKAPLSRGFFIVMLSKAHLTSHSRILHGLILQYVDYITIQVFKWVCVVCSLKRPSQTDTEALTCCLGSRGLMATCLLCVLYDRSALWLPACGESHGKNVSPGTDYIICRAFCKMEGEGNGNPLQYSCLGNPMDGGAW